MKPTILFFDSSMRGLSVYQEVRKLLPDAHYLYCFDNAFFPYSEKPEEMLIERIVNICRKIEQSYSPDMIVVACNTASTIVLPALREMFTVPIVGTVPAIKPAAEISQTKHIGLLATKGTVKRTYVNELINQYAQHCHIEKIGSTRLVEIAEQKLHGYSVDLMALRHELTPWITICDLDTVILGCTHFPLIKEEIKLCLPQVKYFLDPGYAIAKRVFQLLEDLENNIKERSKNEMKNLIFCTKHFEFEYRFRQTMTVWGFERLSLLNLD